MALQDFFTRNPHDADGYRWSLQQAHVAEEDVRRFAAELADAFITHHCTTSMAQAWRTRHNGGPPHSEATRRILEAFIGPSFELPPENTDDGQDVVSQRVQAAVAEQLWYHMHCEIAEQENIVHLEPPDLNPTSGGGDSIAVHRTTDGLLFRLWELKKCTAVRLDPTISGAYRQLNSRASRYLAQMTAIGERLDDQRLAEFFSQLPLLWVDASPQASAGISVAIPQRLIPDGDCFSEFPVHFPEFVTPNRLRGLLTAIGDFTDFARQVQEVVWSGL